MVNQKDSWRERKFKRSTEKKGYPTSYRPLFEGVDCIDNSSNNDNKRYKARCRMLYQRLKDRLNLTDIDPENPDSELVKIMRASLIQDMCYGFLRGVTIEGKVYDRIYLSELKDKYVLEIFTRCYNVGKQATEKEKASKKPTNSTNPKVGTKEDWNEIIPSNIPVGFLKIRNREK